MEMVKNMSCAEFADKLASKEPVPGGGGAAALAGALGVSLGNMVGALTVGKKKYKDVELEMYDLCSSATRLRMRLLALVEEDSNAFRPLSEAYGMPHDTPEEQAKKDQVMEEALTKATIVPLRIMHACCESIDLLQEFADKGSRIAVSDAGAGAAIARGALRAAAFNVYINTKSLKDREKAAAFDKEADGMREEYLAKAEKICEEVEAYLRKDNK